MKAHSHAQPLKRTSNALMIVSLNSKLDSILGIHTAQALVADHGAQPMMSQVIV